MLRRTVGCGALWAHLLLLGAPAAAAGEATADLRADRDTARRLDACYAAAAAVDPAAYGRVVLLSEVQADGSLGAARLAEGGVGVEAADRCLEAALVGVSAAPLAATGARLARLSRAWVPAADRPTRGLERAIRACGAPPPFPDAVVARVEVALGAPQAVDFRLPDALPAAQAACIEQALWHAPHRLGSGTRFFLIELQD